MQIQLIAVGTKMPKWVELGFKEYQRRMPKICQLTLSEVPAIKRGKNADTLRILRDEAKLIETAKKADSVTIALDRKGKHISTDDLAQFQQDWIDQSRNVAIVIGGPEGLDQDFLKNADHTWSLSALTFAHPVVRVMLAEQLYRAWSINANLPYHRGD